MLHLLLAALLFVQSTKDVDSSPLHAAAKTGSQEDQFTRLQRYMKSDPETLEELTNTKYALSEGDIVLSDDRNAVERTWPTVEIAYDIRSDLVSRTDNIVAAMAMVSEHTCVSFHRRTSETNCLMFSSSNGCASYVGFIGGEQAVFVGPKCSVGNIVHEILHALGFHHEHTRTDREQHIIVLEHNVMDGTERNFKKREGHTFNLQYDLSSIMHYGGMFFSYNGLPTIIPISPVKDMGQRVKMTEIDIKRVRLLYSCDNPQNETTSESGVEEEKEEDDAHRLISFHDVTSPPGTKNRKPEEDHTAASPSATLQHLNIVTREHQNTSREEEQSERFITKT